MHTNESVNTQPGSRIDSIPITHTYTYAESVQKD